MSKGLLIVEAAVLIAALVLWGVSENLTLPGFVDKLFVVGVGTLCLGVLIMMGAWTGNRTVSIAYMRFNPPDADRDARYMRRAYSDLNLLTIAGVLTMVASIALGQAIEVFISTA